MPSLAEIDFVILDEQNLNPFTQGYFVPSSVEIGQMVLEMIFKCCQCPWKRER